MGAIGVQEFIRGIQHLEVCLNALFSIIAPDLYKLGVAAIQKLHREHNILFSDPPQSREKEWTQVMNNVALWPTVFSGLAVIANRVTPAHRDDNGYYPWYDLLYSGGLHTKALLKVPDLNKTFLYKPGTVTAICGAIFRHQVKVFTGEDRVCFAHYMRFGVIDRMQLPVRDPDYVLADPLLEACDPKFVKRNLEHFSQSV